jgi:hypothetical protein
VGLAPGPQAQVGVASLLGMGMGHMEEGEEASNIDCGGGSATSKQAKKASSERCKGRKGRRPRAEVGGGLPIVLSCLVLSYTRPVLGERSSLGRAAAALLASCPPPTTLCISLLGPACGLWCRPSLEFPWILLSGSSVGQRGISAQTIQLLVCL